MNIKTSKEFELVEKEDEFIFGEQQMKNNQYKNNGHMVSCSVDSIRKGKNNTWNTTLHSKYYQYNKNDRNYLLKFQNQVYFCKL